MKSVQQKGMNELNMPPKSIPLTLRNGKILPVNGENRKEERLHWTDE